jgi:8-oxo-dGTP diphosphatase
MRFNIRVYGLLVENEQVLLSEELIKDRWITKFPGGGLEFGEGTISCLEREYREEMALDITCRDHFYTTDFYIASAFDESQVLSIYYLIERKSGGELCPLDQERQKLRWIPLSELEETHLDMIGDRKVVQLLKSRN